MMGQQILSGPLEEFDDMEEMEEEMLDEEEGDDSEVKVSSIQTYILYLFAF